MERKLDVLIDARTISNRVAELGREISRDYQGRHPLLVGVLKGAVVFLSDLMRSLTVPVEIDFMAVSSYGYSTTSSGVVRILKDLEKSLEGKDVLIVEDIVDTGLTLNYLRENLASRKPNSLKVVTLLDKPERRRVEFTADYCGFVIPDYFVVGYGLDYNEKYRHLPDLCILKGEEE
ncbi:MAG: hypoxanthine phosphoribosyltransferase [Dethiobacteria bacterium]|jgi:hypoxanthine phosphoribosyltransferase|nr:hypoxanthine phosphoribosyltransferase [Bacillota bacterium]HOP68601.1 hypoxanthine phosphoribosyltransferase [Bacillota bacterium]HPT33318.1 hypoxanthine phosphoribosyltransferase [Bacillota bacterium]HPZ64008.1 hypoxanthine phosphoribosyltransferase [Bacillota bacterium]HQD07029.1 hypoxanthine phosphoribosyltransferase [Bacillota bacterium]